MENGRGDLEGQYGPLWNLFGKSCARAEKSLRKMYENWRTCEQCKSTIFASGRQCEICVPETSKIHDSRRTYDLCNGCVARGYRRSGKRHLMHAKLATAPINSRGCCTCARFATPRFGKSVQSIPSFDFIVYQPALDSVCQFSSSAQWFGGISWLPSSPYAIW